MFICIYGNIYDCIYTCTCIYLQPNIDTDNKIEEHFQQLAQDMDIDGKVIDTKWIHEHINV